MPMVKIIALPDGKDPDEVIQANPEQWRTLVAGARPAMDFYIGALTAIWICAAARARPRRWRGWRRCWRKWQIRSSRRTIFNRSHV